MNLCDVKRIDIPRRYQKRKGIGLGSKKGKTAGRGTKGQQSRSGYSRRYGLEGGQNPLFRRLPKRGFSNARFKVEYAVLNLSALNRFEAGSTVDLEAARQKGLVPKGARRLKILGSGEVDRSLLVKAHRFSVRAREAIEKAGGTPAEVK
jgi:large subunit ribosomal protein L15